MALFRKLSPSAVLSIVNGLNDSRTKPVKKVMALDRMHNLLKPSFISPFIFGSILVMYSIARSKMAVNIYGKLHPARQCTTMKLWVDGPTMEISTLPEGDLVTAIDNDQVLMKTWTVKSDNRAQISILTSVCSAEAATGDSVLQKDETLSPRYECKILYIVGFILECKVL